MTGASKRERGDVPPERGAAGAKLGALWTEPEFATLPDQYEFTPRPRAPEAPRDP